MRDDGPANLSRAMGTTMGQGAETAWAKLNAAKGHDQRPGGVGRGNQAADVHYAMGAAGPPGSKKEKAKMRHTST